MGKLVPRMGRRIETVSSLPGAGDLYVTCQGGRSGRMGHMLDTGVDPEEAMDRMHGEYAAQCDVVDMTEHMCHQVEMYVVGVGAHHAHAG
jgi:glycerol-3-phosphate dehydrogenase